MLSATSKKSRVYSLRLFLKYQTGILTFICGASSYKSHSKLRLDSPSEVNRLRIIYSSGRM